MDLTRREMLKLAATAGAAAALPLFKFTRAGAGGDESPSPASPAFTPFALPLAFPKRAMPTGMGKMRFSGVMVPRYDVYQRVVWTEMLPGFRTAVRTYTQDPNATSVEVGLGPTFEFDRTTEGRQHGVVVRQFNQLPGKTPTTVHLHGARVASEDDGHPFLARSYPGEVRDYCYQNDQIAAFMWYHDHALFFTSENVYKGFAGLYLLHDDFERSLNLPSGAFDIPLVVQDRAFNRDGSLNYPHIGAIPTEQGAFGDVICVNAKAMPRLEVQPRKYRFRILNGSNARIYNFRLSTGDGFFVIGSEHGFLKKTVPTDHLFMATGERYSIIIDFSKYKPGTRVLLTNDIDPDPYGDPVDPGHVNRIMAFDVVDGDGSKDNTSTEVGWHPDTASKFDITKVTKTRNWEFVRDHGMWTVNGLGFDENRIDAHPKIGTTEIWNVRNPGGGWLHPAHPHLVKALIIERSPGGVRPWETGLKDMASLGANEEAKMLINFDAPPEFAFGNSDTKALYPMHCHNVDHEDHDMMSHWRLEA